MIIKAPYNGMQLYYLKTDINAHGASRTFSGRYVLGLKLDHAWALNSRCKLGPRG